MTPVLEASDLLLRPFVIEDAQELAAAVVASQREIGRFMDWAHPQYGVDDAQTFIRSTLVNRRAATAFDYGIFSAGGELAGVVSINNLHEDHHSGNVGYWIRTSKTRQGLASAAVKAIVPFGFEALKLVRLEIVAAESNRASRRVAEKVGAQFECIARNRLVIHGQPTPAAIYSLIPPVVTG